MKILLINVYHGGQILNTSTGTGYDMDVDVDEDVDVELGRSNLEHFNPLSSSGAATISYSSTKCVCGCG
jgi:hypothetical protein